MKYLICFLAIGGWLLFDGCRALITGHYTVPQSGPHAGMLGPWSLLVSAVGLDPMGMALKILHVLLGVSWIASGLWLPRNAIAAWWPLMITALLNLWYAPFGTIAGVAVVSLLLLPSMR